MWQVRLAFVSAADQNTALNLLDCQLSQIGFVQPNPGETLSDTGLRSSIYT